MAKKPSLVEQIQNDAFDSGTSIGDALRKCIALGARPGGEELRAGAARELRGYEDGTDVPEYRKIAAPMVIDGLSGNRHFERLQISTHDLPQPAESKIDETVELRAGIKTTFACISTLRDTHSVCGW